MRLTMKITLLTWLGIVLSCSGVHADVDKLRVVGTWSSLTLFKNFEKPFWTETVPQELGIETTMTSLGQVKLKGPAVVRQMDMGVFDVVHTVADYIVSDSPDLSGLDLPGVTTDIATAKKTVEAYRPALEEYLARDFNVKLLSVVPYPAQVLFCRVEIGGLDDLKGRKSAPPAGPPPNSSPRLAPPALPCHSAKYRSRFSEAWWIVELPGHSRVIRRDGVKFPTIYIRCRLAAGTIPSGLFP